MNLRDRIVAVLSSRDVVLDGTYHLDEKSAQLMADAVIRTVSEFHRTVSTDEFLDAIIEEIDQ